MFTTQLSVESNDFEQARPDLERVLFPIEMRIVERLYALCPEGYAADRAHDWESTAYWTRRVKETLKEVGEAEDLLVFPTLVRQGEEERFEGQWLLDLVWVDAKKDRITGEPDWKGTRGLKLACECEWATSETKILEDFFKLTFAVADLRLFIYTNKQIRAGQASVDPIDLCKRACPLSHGFRYLALGFPYDRRGRFRIDSWIA